MDNWRRNRYSCVSKALGRIERRTDKVVERLNGSTGGVTQHSKISLWTAELARLQEMSDLLMDFRGRLYFYSNRDYVEGLNEWEGVIEKICKKSKDLGNAASGHKHPRRSPAAPAGGGHRVRHRSDTRRDHGRPLGRLPIIYE